MPRGVATAKFMILNCHTYVQGDQVLTNGDLVLSDHGNSTRNGLYHCLLRTAHGSNLTVASYNITVKEGKL